MNWYGIIFITVGIIFTMTFPLLLDYAERNDLI